MINKFLTSILLLAFVPTNLTSEYTLRCPAANDYQRADSPYKGQYRGPYTVEASVFGEQTGRFTLSINQNGEVTGTAENFTVDRKADINGSVTEDGDIKLIVEWSDSTYTIKGTVTKTKQGHLKGTLNQYAGKEVIATIKMDLPPT